MGFWDSGSGCRLKLGVGFWDSGSGCRVLGFRLRVCKVIRDSRPKSILSAVHMKAPIGTSDVLASFIERDTRVNNPLNLSKPYFVESCHVGRAYSVFIFQESICM